MLHSKRMLLLGVSSPFGVAFLGMHTRTLASKGAKAAQLLDERPPLTH
jgi:hypothetical protein